MNCAWCLSEQGIPAGEGSHDICKKHAKILLKQYRSLKEIRAQSKGVNKCQKKNLLEPILFY